MTRELSPVPYLKLRQVKGGEFVLFYEGRIFRKHRFRHTRWEACAICGADPPTFVPVGDRGMMAMCEGCIVEVLARMAFAAEGAIERRGKRNGQG
jgi:hypothetical protein